MVNSQRVLVIDGMHEIQDVLRTVLAPKGLRVDWWRSHGQSNRSDSMLKPDVVVIDAESYSECSAWNDIPQIRLEGDPSQDVTASTTRVLRKPFQFPELIDAIVRLLPNKPS